jgi:hypothetical protein
VALLRTWRSVAALKIAPHDLSEQIGERVEEGQQLGWWLAWFGD